MSSAMVYSHAMWPGKAVLTDISIKACVYYVPQQEKPLCTQWKLLCTRT